MGVIVVVVMATSAWSQSRSVASARSVRDVVVVAGRVGDYATARKVWGSRLDSIEDRVLGAEVEIEELIYPERVIEREIERYLVLLERYPGHRDVYLVLARLYQEIGEVEKGEYYWEQARILDPNNEVFVR
jgi:tetratricopeptide (TPR) repeat protein